MKNIYIFGIGSQAKILARMIKFKKNLELIYFISDKKIKKKYLQKNIISVSNFLKIKEHTRVFIAIGDNQKRKKIYNVLKKKKKD